jgi:hypothetical protein
MRQKVYWRCGVATAALLSLSFSDIARADEGGVSFWVPAEKRPPAAARPMITK